MNILRLNYNKESSYQILAGEMLNMESGLKVFENGRFIHNEHNLYHPYPNIIHEGVWTTIKSNVGYIIVDENFNHDKIREILIKKENKSYYKKLNSDNTPIALDTTSLNIWKVKKKFERDTLASYYSNIFNRCIVKASNTHDNYESSRSYNIGRHKFTWIIVNKLSYINNILLHPESSIKHYQTIIFEKPYTKIKPYLSILAFGENIKYDSTSIFDLAYFKNFIPLTLKGVITDKHFDEKIEPDSDDYISENIQTLIDNINKKNIFKNSKICELFSTSNFIASEDIICISSMGSAIEIYRKNNKLYPADCNFIIRDNLERDVWETSYDNITINNTLFELGLQCVEEDSCGLCGSLLYDEFYVIIDKMENINNNNIEGFAVCAVCMHIRHSKYSPKTVGKLIFKTRHPTSINDIINNLNYNQLTSAVLATCSNPDNIIELKNNYIYAVYIKKELLSNITSMPKKYINMFKDIDYDPLFIMISYLHKYVEYIHNSEDPNAIYIMNNIDKVFIIIRSN